MTMDEKKQLEVLVRKYGIRGVLRTISSVVTTNRTPTTGVIMHVNTETLALLKKYGFKWYKNQCTDSVDADGIQDVVPSAGGFTVIYKDDPQCPFTMSTATVEKIEIPPATDLDKTWIFVHWETIKDSRKTASIPLTER